MFSFRNQKKIGPRPDWSPLRVKFKTSENPTHRSIQNWYVTFKMLKALVSVVWGYHLPPIFHKSHSYRALVLVTRAYS